MEKNEEISLYRPPVGKFWNVLIAAKNAYNLILTKANGLVRTLNYFPSFR